MALGATVFAAGHVKRGRAAVDLSDVAEAVEIVPAATWRAGEEERIAWLRGVLSRVEPDLVQAHSLPTWGYYATHCGTGPVALTAWGSDLYLADGAARTRADRALAQADAVIARSLHMERAMLARGVSPERLHHAQLGVELERFRPPSPGEADRLRVDLGLPPGPLVLSFRAGTDLYRLDVVIAAFRLVHARVPDATLVLVTGDAPLSPRVEASLSGPEGAAGIVRVGRIPHAEMARFMRAATVGISIPISDGSPNSVWEALASGLPLVLSDLPQVEERVGGSGAVRLVEPSPAAVASALHDLVTRPDLRDEMAHAARAWALANVDERDQRGAIAAVYAAAMRTRAARREAA